jgi:hypothetical protein
VLSLARKGKIFIQTYPSFARKDIFMSIESFSNYLKDGRDPIFEEQQRLEGARFRRREEREQVIRQRRELLEQQRRERAVVYYAEAVERSQAILDILNQSENYRPLYRAVRTEYGRALQSPFFDYKEGVKVGFRHHEWTHTSGGINLHTSRHNDFELGIKGLDGPGIPIFLRYASWPLPEQRGSERRINYPGPVYPWNWKSWSQNEEDDAEVIEILKVISQGLDNLWAQDDRL